MADKNNTQSEAADDRFTYSPTDKVDVLRGDDPDLQAKIAALGAKPIGQDPTQRPETTGDTPPTLPVASER